MTLGDPSWPLMNSAAMETPFQPMNDSFDLPVEQVIEGL